MPLTRLAHARALLVSDEAGATGYIHADVRDTGAVLAQILPAPSMSVYCLGDPTATSRASAARPGTAGDAG